MIQLVLLLILLLGVIGGMFWLRRQPNIRLRVRDLVQPPNRRPWYASRGRPGLIILALIFAIALWLVLQNLGLLTAAPPVASGEFVVRIAPFRSTAEDQRQGEIVADQLLQGIKSRVTTPMNVGVLTQPITSAQQALEQAQTNTIDVIIWGDVAEGTTADQPGLRPRLLWRPGEPFAPRTWQGYDGHFAIPADYDLALADLNGPAVLAPLLDAINNFSRGDADKAATLLDTLRRDYGDVLRDELPAMLRAQILWAEGLLPDAEREARAALAATRRPEHWNNLGAILLDQQQLEAAREPLMEAVAADPGMAQAHANLGRLLMDQGQPAAALPDLRSAASAVPNSPPFLGALGEAYRRSGQLDGARAAATAVLTLDPNNGPALAEQSMLALTPVTTTERLEWELYDSPTRSADELATIRSRAERGIAAIEALRNEFLRRANAYGVAGRPVMQRLAETQAARLEQELLNRRYQLMLIQIEQGRVLALQPRSRMRRFFDAITGARTPFTEAIATAGAALKQEPSIDLQYDYHYQQGRAAFLSQNTKLASAQFDAAQQLADTAPATTTLKTRPEARYGRAQLLLADGKRAEARTELQAALAANERFFPARELLANMAEADKQWPDAATQYRWLAANRSAAPRYQLKLARALREQGATADAEAQLLPLANADNPDALVMLATLYREAGKLDAAKSVLQRALTTAPTSAAAHEEAAAIALAQHDPQTAEAELRKALEIEPQRISAHIALARLYANSGKPAAAAEQFQAAVANNSADPLVQRQLGEVLLEAGNPTAAETSFKNALKLAPDSHEAHHGLATAYLAQGKYDAATKEEQRALELANGNYTLAIVGLGDIAREQGRYDEAVKQYTTALDRDPRLAAAYLGLGKATLAQGQPAIALQHYRAGLAANPNNVALLIGQGDALLQQNDIDGARTSYEQAKQLAPGNAAAYAGLGRSLWKAGQTDAALVTLDQAAQLNANDADTLLTIGEINASLERNDVALQAYSKAAEARKDWYEPRFRRGVLLLKLQQTDQAINELQAAVKLKPDFAQASYWLGRAYRAAGQFAAARSQFQRAIQLQGNYYEARYFLGRTLDELGQAPDAVATYTAIINEAPPNDPWRAEAQRELDRIR